MKWEHRHFDSESNEHSGENPHLNVLCKCSTVFNQIRDRKAFCPCLEEQCQERNEHESRTEHGVQKELQRCVLTIFAAPHTDHEVHRQQHEFEEDEEQNKVLRDKRSCHSRLQYQHQREEGFRVSGRRDVVKAVDHHEQRDHHR